MAKPHVTAVPSFARTIVATQSDVADLPTGQAQGVRAGSPGSGISIVDPEGNQVDLAGVIGIQVGFHGSILPVDVARVRDTGTTAGAIIFYQE